MFVKIPSICFVIFFLLVVGCKFGLSKLESTEEIYGVTDQEYERNLSVDDIESRIVKNLDFRKPIKVEQVLELLPKEMFKNFVVALNSESRQESSKEFPRIISFMPNGSLIASFNGSERHEANSELEVIEFDQTTDEMNFYRIIFSKDPGSEKYYQIVKNPGVCFDCHGSKDAPIPQWGHYPEWPNFLGSFDDLLLPDGDQRKTISRAEDTCAGSLTVNVAKKTKDESIVVRDNRAQWIVHPRYKYFFANDRGNELYPYSKNFRGKFSLRPNLRLGTLLHRRFIKDRLKRLRRKNVKLYDYSFPLYLFDHFECSNILPESKKLRNDIVAKVSGLFSEAAFTQDGDWQSEFLLSFDETFFDLDFNPGGRASSTGFFSGFLNSKQLIATYLYRSTVLKRPGINAFVEEADINGCYPGYGPAYAKFIVKLGGKISPKAAQLPNLCQSLAQIYVPK